MGVRVIEAGTSTTVQDLGRTGYMNFAFPPAGAMDTYSAGLANILVGNYYYDALLECYDRGPSLEFTSTGAFAITGASMKAKLNGNEIRPYSTYTVNPGDVLTMESAQDGVYTYLAFAGGLEIPKYLGSRSTSLESGIGGFKGRALNKDDVLAFNDVYLGRKELEARELEIRHIPSDEVLGLRVMSWPEAEDNFSEKGLDAFYSQTYSVGEGSGRTNYKLSGGAIEFKDKKEGFVEGTVFGLVQVSPSGLPVINLADRPTCNEEKSIAVLATVDVPLLVQRRPGQKVKFSQISIEKAQRLLLKRHNEFVGLEDKLYRQSRLSGGVRHTAERIESLLK